jgi:hypothetical protein
LSETAAVAAKIAIALATAVCLLATRIRSPVPLAALGVAGGLGWWWFFVVPVWDNVHEHDAFHYFLAAKYFPEVRYDGLYLCALAADLEEGRDPGARIRDLASNELVPAVTRLDDARACRARFAPDRWAAFRADLDWFRARLAPGEWQQIREDHGFNGSPVWLLGGSLLARAPGGARALPWLALADPLLLAAMWAGVVWAFGWRTAAVAAVFWGTNGFEGMDWTGGSLLRQDWLAALVLGIACLRKGHRGLAGALLATSTLLRVFPALVVAGVVARRALAAASARSLDPLRGLARFAAGGALATALLVPLATWQSGAAAWPAFAANSRKLAGTPLLNHVGLPVLAAFDADRSARRLEQAEAAEPFEEWKRLQRERRAERRSLAVAFALLWATLFARALPSQGDWSAAALAIGAIPVATALTGYYQAALVGMALLCAVRTEVGAVLCLLAAATQAIRHWVPYSDVPFALMSGAELVAVFAVTGLLAGDARTGRTPNGSTATPAGR